MTTKMERAAGQVTSVPVRSVRGAMLAFAPALRHRNFRLFWLGQLVSVMGTSVQVVAEGWLIYELTQSTFWLGMVGLLGLIPVVPISLLGGVLIDRVPRRKLLLLTQAGLMIQAAIFGFLAWTGTIQLWHIIGLYFVFGALMAIDHPARRAFLVELVDETELANAVAMNATLFNFSSLIGYGLAGVLIAIIGVASTMVFNSLTYVAPLAALALIRVADVRADIPEGEHAQRGFQVALMEGFVTLWRQPTILGAITVMAVAGGLAFPVLGLMPAFADEVLGVGAMGLGILMASGALGSVLGTALVARMGTKGRGLTLVQASIVLSALVIGFAFTPNLWIGCILLVALGSALLVVQSLAITLVQIHIPDRVRGRVMSIYSQVHAGSDTMSNVAIGALAVYSGLPLALIAGGGLAFVYVIGLRLMLPSISELD